MRRTTQTGPTTRRLVVAMTMAAVAGVALGPTDPAAAQQPGTTTSTVATAGQAPGAATTVDQVAMAVAADGWFADPAVTSGRDDLAGLAGRLSGEAEPIGFAVLAAEPEGSSTAFAEQVLDALPGQGERGVETVAVLSPDDVGVVSDVWDDQAIDDALDDAIDELRSDPVAGLDALADALAREPTMAQQDRDADAGPSSDGGSGISPVWIGLGVLGLIVLAVARRFLPGATGYDDGRWGSSYHRRRRWRSSGRSSLFGGSRRSGTRRSSRSSRGSRRGRGGRRL